MRFLKHDGCDLCIFKCTKPILLSVGGKKYKGHKDCMKKVHDEIRKQKRK